MSKYEWNLEELIKKEEEYERKAQLYQELMITFREMISSYNLDLEGYKGQGDISFEKTDELTTYKQDVLDVINKEKINIVNSSMNIFKNYLYNPYPFQYAPLKISDKELVEVTFNLIRTLPNKRLVQKIESFIDPKDNLLHIKPNDELPTDAMGLTFINVKEHKSYGLVARNYTIEDIITLAHELIHMVIRQKQLPGFYNSSYKAFTETEGFFANLLFNDLLKQHHFLDDNDNCYDTRDLINVATYSTDAFISLITFNKFKNKDEIDFEGLNRYLLDFGINSDINDDNLLYFMNENIEFQINYITSYLTALDLYKGYATDPEKTLNNLFQIPTLSENNIYHSLEQIDATFHKDGYKNLNEHCKKLLKTK